MISSLNKPPDHYNSCPHTSFHFIVPFISFLSTTTKQTLTLFLCSFKFNANVRGRRSESAGAKDLESDGDLANTNIVILPS